METIFDHNPTDEELMRFGGREHFEKDKKYGIVPSADSNYYMIGMLYAMRKDYYKANRYWHKIKDKSILSTLVQDYF